MTSVGVNVPFFGCLLSCSTQNSLRHSGTVMPGSEMGCAVCRGEEALGAAELHALPSSSAPTQKRKSHRASGVFLLG